MKRQQGSILVIVLMLAAAFYLLASLVLIVHRQYIDDVDLTQSAMLSRQKLLRMSQSVNVVSDDKMRTVWPHCNEIVPPEVGMSIWHESERVWLSQLQLPNECGDGQSAHYVWLQDDAHPLPLQMNVMIPQTVHWQRTIESLEHGIDVQREKDGWQLRIEQQGLHRLPLMDHDADDQLLWQRFRLTADHYEGVLLWQTATGVMIERIKVPFEHLTLEVVHQESVRRVTHLGEGLLMLNHVNETHSTHWQVTIAHWHAEQIRVADGVIWLSVHQQHERALVALYLEGEPFFGQGVVGVIRTERELSESRPIILKPCIYGEPWVMDEDWQVGCRAQKRVRYVFGQ